MGQLNSPAASRRADALLPLLLPPSPWILRIIRRFAPSSLHLCFPLAIPHSDSASKTLFQCAASRESERAKCQAEITPIEWPRGRCCGVI